MTLSARALLQPATPHPLNVHNLHIILKIYELNIWFYGHTYLLSRCPRPLDISSLTWATAETLYFVNVEARLRRQGAMRIDHGIGAIASTSSHPYRPSSPTAPIADRQSWGLEYDSYSHTALEGHLHTIPSSRFSRIRQRFSRWHGPHATAALSSISMLLPSSVVRCGWLEVLLQVQ
jgi:hypothetical protein